MYLIVFSSALENIFLQLDYKRNGLISTLCKSNMRVSKSVAYMPL